MIKPQVDKAVQIEIGKIAKIYYFTKPETIKITEIAFKEFSSKYNRDRIKLIQQIFFFLQNPTPVSEESFGVLALFYYFQFTESEMKEATSQLQVLNDEDLNGFIKEYGKFTKGKIKTFEQITSPR